MLAAADTFRAAAIDQLEVWAKGQERSLSGSRRDQIRLSSMMRSRRQKPEKSMFICDTAGRHYKENLMEELRRFHG